jgi:peptidoglycan/LPS O-acetylase OafA/YrhL
LENGKRYFENLDASRFIAFVAVFLTHTFYSNDPVIKSSNAWIFVQSHLQLGLLALDYFFVLSAFLITWIILEEYRDTGSFKPGLFLIRRALRIWPLYFLIVAIGFIGIYALSSSQQSEPLPSLFYFLTFTLNFYIASNGYHFLFLLVFLWSISVEEQFYIFWAFFLKYFRKHLVAGCMGLIILSLIFRASQLDNENQLSFNTLSALSNFAMGALAARLAFYRGAFFEKVVLLPRWAIAGLHILFFLNVAFYHHIYHHPAMVVPERFIFSLFFAFFILEQSFCEHSFLKIGGWKPVNYLGRISLGLYCYHGVVITLLIKAAEKYSFTSDPLYVFLLVPIAVFCCTILLAILSHELLEKKVAKLKNRFYPRKPQLI